MQNIGPDVKLPINVTPSSQTAPLLRAAFDGVRLGISRLQMDRSEIIRYMGDVSTKFDDGVEFTLMIPLLLSWTMDQANVTLRDYPLSLVRVQPVESGDRPSWNLETPFIIAEEMRGG